MSEPLSAQGLAAFAAVVEAGSIQGAAEALGLTQSATTKRVQALERRLGATLLLRGRQGARPTIDGSALYPEARLALDAIAAAERAVVSGRESRPLRIAASHTVGECILPAWLGHFRATSPGLHPHVDVVNSPRVIAAVHDDAADMGFVEGLDSLDGLETLTIAHDEIVLVVGADHRWARRREVRPTELAGEPFISRESGSGTRAVGEARLAEVDVHLEPALTMASLEAVKRSIAIGGFALLSCLAVRDEVAFGSLAKVPIAGVEIKRPLTAIRPLAARRSEPGRRFWHWLADR